MADRTVVERSVEIFGKLCISFFCSGSNSQHTLYGHTINNFVPSKFRFQIESSGFFSLFSPAFKNPPKYFFVGSIIKYVFHKRLSLTFVSFSAILAKFSAVVFAASLQVFPKVLSFALILEVNCFPIFFREKAYHELIFSLF